MCGRQGANVTEYTTFLYARPSFLEGIARILDFGNTLQVYNASGNELEADAVALALDWYAIGEDMKRAVQEITQARMAGAHEQTEVQQNPI